MNQTDRVPPELDDERRAHAPSRSVDRFIPPYDATERAPGYYCLARNVKRGKYCAARAGQGTDHVGLGRCKFHGGASPLKHGLRSRFVGIDLHRLGELIAKHEADPDPLNTLPEIAAMRALFEDFILRYEPNRAALLAWHASFSEEYRRESEAALATWIEDGNSAESFIPPKPIPTRPREVLDISDARQILSEIAKAVERAERVRYINAIPLAEQYRIIGAMAEVVRDVVQDTEKLHRIADAWGELPVRLKLVH